MEKAPETEVDKFYSDIEKAIEKSTKNMIILGDFNAKIGISSTQIGSIIGLHGSGTFNERGERLKQFALDQELSIINTLFMKKENQRWTWCSPDGLTRNEIDFILSNRPHFFTNIEVIRKLTFPSDHRLLRGTIQITRKNVSRKKFTNSKPNLESEKEHTLYRKILKEKLDRLYPDENLTIQQLYDVLVNAISESLNETKTSKNREQFKLSNNLKSLISERHALQLKNDRTINEKAKLRELYRLISRNIQDEYDTYKLKRYEKCIELTGGIKRVHKKLQNSQDWIPKLKNSQAIITGNRKDLVLTATQFYTDLYSKEQVNIVQDQTLIHPNDLQESPQPFSEKEIELAIKNLSNQKSPGPDCITNETIKGAGNVIISPLTKLFNCVLEHKSVPKQWSESEIILLYKKGDPSSVSNYRPISLMTNFYKLFSQCLLKRIGPKIDKKQPIEQAGFRPAFSTIDHIHVICQIVEKYREFNRPLYLAFIDYKKAFDSISHDAITEALKYHEIENTYIEIIMQIYKNCKSRVKLDRKGPFFRVYRGTRQGDPLSPKIFIAVLEWILHDIKWKDKGIKIGDKQLSHLRFADDLVLLSENGNKIQDMMSSLYQCSKKVGLEINFEKTKIMTNFTQTLVNINNQRIEYVDDYVYLGKLISFREIDTEEISRRINLAWKRYWSLKYLFKSNIPIRHKSRLMDSTILPTLTYGCQSWSLTEANTNRIAVCQRNMERSFLKIKLKDKVRNEEIRKRTKIKDAAVHIRRMKWKWAGHLARYEDGRWTRIVTKWRGPESGKRRPGRPLKRWSDDIRAVAGPHWLTRAQDRDTWQSLEEAFTRTGAP